MINVPFVVVTAAAAYLFAMALLSMVVAIHARVSQRGYLRRSWSAQIVNSALVAILIIILYVGYLSVLSSGT